MLKTLHRSVDVLKLIIAIRMRAAFLGLAMALQAISGRLPRKCLPRSDLAFCCSLGTDLAASFVCLN